MTTALLIGATGLVGGHAIALMLDDPRFERVTVFTRRPTGLAHARLVEHVVDFGNPDAWRDRLQGDVLISALGTTRKAAGSAEAQRAVDYGIQYRTACDAAANGVSHLVLVSSPHANAESRNAYRRMKGELERDVSALNLPGVSLLQPGPLLGDRPTMRAGERIVAALHRFEGLFPKDSLLRPIAGRDVARAAVTLAREPFEGRRTLRLGALQDLL